MSPRSAALASLSLATLAALLTQSLCYGLVYPARAQGSKLSIGLALLGGTLVAAFAGWLSYGARRRATVESERFLALVSLVVSAFFAFVIIFGFGIPSLFHSLGD